MRIRLSELRRVIRQGLAEGGNARALDVPATLALQKKGGIRSEEEKVFKKFGGKTVAADKIDIRGNRQNFKRDIVEALKKLDDIFKKSNPSRDPLWPEKTRDELLGSGIAFNGSSEHLFGNKIDDAQFEKHKPKVGDIDLTIPKEKIKELWNVLFELEGRGSKDGFPLTSKVHYVGQNKEKQEGEQINALFAYYPDPSKKAFSFVQIDFEAVDYTEKGEPDEFAKFGHSSSWDDIQQSVKGVFHKYLLRSLTELGKLGDVTIITNRSPLWPPEKRTISTDVEAKLHTFSIVKGLRNSVELMFYPEKNSKEDLDAISDIKSKLKLTAADKKKLENLEKKMIPDDLLGKQVKDEGRPVYRIVDPKESTYEKDIGKMTCLFFTRPGKPPVLHEKENENLIGSFVGIMELMKKHELDDEEIGLVYRDFIKKLFGVDAQRLERKSYIDDLQAKESAIKKFKENFPHLKTYDGVLEQEMKNYYGVGDDGKIDGHKYVTKGIEEAFINILNLVKG